MCEKLNTRENLNKTADMVLLLQQITDFINCQPSVRVF